MQSPSDSFIFKTNISRCKQNAMYSTFYQKSLLTKVALVETAEKEINAKFRHKVLGKLMAIV